MPLAKILIIDDMQINLQILHRYLLKENFAIETANSGFEALEFIDDFLPDIILVDVCMPGMDGIETAKRILEKMPTKPVIIFISALKDTETKRRAMEIGGASFFNKPVNLKLLSSTINKCLKSLAWSNGEVFDESLKSRKSNTVRIEKPKKESTLFHFSKLKDLGQLSSSIAHDINNYLGGILGNVSLIELTTDDSEVLGYCSEIKKAVSNTSDLTETLTNYSKSKQSAAQLVNIGEALNDALNLLKRDRRYSANVKLNIKVEKPLFDGVYSELTNIFLNILKNAYQAVSDSGEIYVSLVCKEISEQQSILNGKLEPGTYYQLAFEDNGKGIKPEVLKHIFEPFFTTKEEGTGLGLSSVLRHLQNNGANMDLKSTIGKGTRVTLYFPIAGCEGVSDTVEADGVGEVIDFQGKRFVLMDDDVVFCNSLAGYLQKHKAKVISFTDASFNDFVETNPGLMKYDYLITDYNSPFFNCFELVKSLSEKNKDIFTFIVSGTDVNTAGLERCRAFRKPLVFADMAQEIIKVQ